MGVAVDAVRPEFVHHQERVGAATTGAAVLDVADIIGVVGGADDVHFMSVLRDQDAAANEHKP